MGEAEREQLRVAARSSGSAWRPEPGGTDPVVEAMGELARDLQREHSDVEETLAAVTRAAVQGVPGALHASVTLVDRKGGMENRAATADLPRLVDAIQTEVGQGPCIEALRDRRTVRVDDMAGDRRWPAFSGRAAAAGVGSMLAFQLFVQDGDLGALNLYSDRPAAFTEVSEDIGLMFAAHAAVALVGAQQEAGLRLALNSRDVIGQAKGILMERYKLSGQQAFLLLVRASQRANVKLRDIADQLVVSGEFGRP